MAPGAPPDSASIPATMRRWTSNDVAPSSATDLFVSVVPAAPFSAGFAAGGAAGLAARALSAE